MRNKKIAIVAATVIFTIVLLYILDQILMVSYLVKTSIKLFFLLLLPIVYSLYFKDDWIKKSLRRPSFPHLRRVIILSFMVFSSIIVLFLLLQRQLHLETIIFELEDKYNIHANTFIFYGAYITFLNSLIEEFFFRGFVFLNLKNLGFKKWGHALSSVSFAIYHITIFKNWFSVSVFLLALGGLIAGGIIFNLLDDRPNNFLNSYIVHMSADLAIIMIGFYMFLQ